jgi:hypothetical protein
VLQLPLHACTVEAVHFTHLFRRIQPFVHYELCTEGDVHLFAQDSGPRVPFFDKRLNAAAGSGDVGLGPEYQLPLSH